MKNLKTQKIYARCAFRSQGDGSPKSVANIPVAMAKVSGYYIVFTPLSTYLVAVAEGSGINGYIVFAVTMLTNFATEFLFCKLVVYRNQENTRK